jgi:opacity protein-like surface antigen
MKRAIVLLVLTAVLASAAQASVSAGLRVSYFSPSDADFRSIYGGGSAFRGEVSAAIASRFDLWLEGGYFGKTGSLTYTLEETKLTLIPLGIGADYHFLEGKVQPYVGAGVLLVFFHETNILGDVKDQALGATIRAGVTVPLSGRVAADIRAAYSLCRMRPADFEFSVGGFEIGAGLAYSF